VIQPPGRHRIFQLPAELAVLPCLLIALCVAASAQTGEGESELWGTNGELWDLEDPENRLRDFTNVGYMGGAVSIPDWPVGVDVTDYGAIPDDGIDDSAAFIEAIADCPNNHAVFVPVGRYIIRQQIIPDRDYFVLRGEDMYETVLFFPKYLNEIYTQEVGYDFDNPGARNTGVPKGFFRVEGGTHRSIENLSFVFRDQMKQGHWEHLGADAMDYNGGVDHWIRNIYIKNSDHAILADGERLSVLNIVVDHDPFTRPSDGGASVGHMPIAIRTGFSLYHNIEITGVYAHDFDLGGGSDNVVSNARGVDLRLHHHSMGADRNLYTNLDMGLGRRALQAFSDSRQENETLWGAFGSQTLAHDTIDPNSQNENVFVGFDAGLDETFTDTFWYEAIDPAVLEPKNIYLAQMSLLQKPLPEGPPPLPPVDNAAPVLRVLPSDDNTVGSSSNNTVNNPESSSLRLTRIFIKFELNELEIDTFHRVRLRLNARVEKTPYTLTLSAVDDDAWTEETITGANAPSPGTVLEVREITGDRGRHWLEFDVTDYVENEYNGDQSATFVLENSKSGTPTGNIESKESSNPLHLVIEQVPSPVPGPPSAPVMTTTQSLIGNVALDWEDSPESDVVSYNVYRTIDTDTADMGVPIGMGLVDSDFLNVNSTANWEVGMMRSDWTYYYAVTAVDSHGYESAPSARFIGTTLDANNAPPTFNGNPAGPINAGIGVDAVGSLSDYASDPEDDALFFFKVDGPDWLSVAFDGTLSGIPGPENEGLNEWTIQVNARGGRDEATLQINVLPYEVFNANPPVVEAGADRSAQLPAAGELWTPYDQTVTAWYDASDATTLTEAGGAVSQWSDKSGNDLHLVQNDSNKQPVSGGTPIDGKNAINFDGSNDSLTTSSNPFGATINDAFVIAVHRIDSVSQGTFFTLSGASNSRWQAHAPWSDGNVYFDMGGNGGSSRVSSSYGVSAGDSVLVSFYGSTTDSVQQILKNGTLLAGDSSGHSVSTAGNIHVGSDGSSNAQDSSIGEFLVINGTVNAEDRQRLEGYLAHKWGLADSLPDDHAFKLFAPGDPVATVDLTGLVNDLDEAPPPAASWSLLSGPAPVQFTDASSAATQVTFIEAGTYVLRLSADDGRFQNSDDLSITVSPATGDPDSDADGLADAWEIEHFGALGQSEGTEDSDGDGLLDFFEYIFGAVPTDANDRGSPLTASASDDGTGMLFRWAVSPGMTVGQHYHVRVSTDLLSWDPPPQEASLQETPGDPTQIELILPADFGEKAFVRLQAAAD
jgi:hypothetical protein